ncbi:MAG TPA: stage V sporulation protein SpoVM [Clostridiales bacterium]|nr:stage V sporulation protein SpoVM [Clostridiales bacterium]
MKVVVIDKPKVWGFVLRKVFKIKKVELIQG